MLTYSHQHGIKIAYLYAERKKLETPIFMAFDNLTPENGETARMEPASPENGQPSLSRRRIIKSTALAVPVVLTLHSGAALALSTAGQRSFQKAQQSVNDNVPIGIPAASTDKWLRSTNLPNSAINVRSATDQDGTTQWYCIKNSTNVADPCAVSGSNPAVGANWVKGSWSSATAGDATIKFKPSTTANSKALGYVYVGPDGNLHVSGIDPLARNDDVPFMTS